MATRSSNVSRLFESIRVRYLAVFVLTTGLYVTVSWLYVNTAFERYVWGHELVELGHEVDALIRLLTSGHPDPTLVQLPSSRYEQPYGGAYWQVQEGSNILARSRSLWDFVLEIPEDGGSHGAHRSLEIAGPNGTRVLSVEREIRIRGKDGERLLCIIVGVDTRQYQSIITGFHNEVSLYVLLLLGLIVAGGILQLTFILKPFRNLPEDVEKAGLDPAWRLHDRYPVEIRPLVEQINRLLDSREAARNRARHAAADLAHGLKTPVAGLQALGRRLRRSGEPAIAAEIERQADTIHRRTMYEVTRAGAMFGLVAPQKPMRLHPILIRLRDALLATTPRDIDLRIEISPDRRVGLAEDDALEVFGVLLDNAVKWARARVIVSDREADHLLVVTITDDGTGGEVAGFLSDIRRGTRLDTRTAGSGFGLSIAREIIEGYGGTLTFAAGPEGGLAASVNLPLGARPGSRGATVRRT